MGLQTGTDVATLVAPDFVNTDDLADVVRDICLESICCNIDYVCQIVLLEADPLPTRRDNVSLRERSVFPAES